MRNRALAGLFALLTLLAPFTGATAQPAACKGVVKAPFFEVIRPPAWPTGAAQIGSYAVDPANPDRVLATNGAVVMETTDGGCSWDQRFAMELLPSLDMPVSSATGSVKLISIPQGASNVIYLVVEEAAGPVARPHVIVSKDRGKTWRAGDQGLPPVSGGAVNIEPAPSDPRTVFLLLRDAGSNEDALYASTDGGTTWQRRNGQGDFPSSGMAVDPLDTRSVWFWGAIGLSHSSNGGQTRALENRLAPPIPLFDIHHVQGRPARLMAYQGETQDFVRSDDGGSSWYPEGTPEGSAISMTHAPGTGQMLMSVHNGLFRFEEPSYWIEITPPGIEEIDLLDLQADATGKPSVYGNARDYLLRYTGLSFQVDLPDVDVDPLPPIDATGANLTPPKKTLEMKPGSTRSVPYHLTLPEHPTGLDVFFIVDVSDSMDATINGLREGMNEIVGELGKSKIDVQFGVGSYKDYPIPGFGDPRGGDYPYRLDRAIGPADESFTQALESLKSSGGGDLPESQLTAIHQAVTGAGDPGFVPPGQGAGWRQSALGVIVHMTDEAFNNSPAHPSPDMQDVANIVSDKGIYHIGLGVWGQNGNTRAVRDLTAFGEMSGSHAPTEVDCDGDGSADIATGEPLVCDVRDETRVGVMNLAPAIIATVKAVTREVPVVLEATGGGSILESVSPEIYPRIDTIESAGLDFDVTFNCPRSEKRTTERVTLQAKVLDVPVASAEVDIVCKALPAALRPPKPKEKKPLAAIVPPPIVPAAAFVAVPPAPPAPIPEPIPAQQPNAQAQGAMAEQEQEQTQLAFVQAGLWQAETEEELAMADYSQRGRRSVPPLALYGAASLMAAGFALVMSRANRTQTAYQRASRF